MSTEIKKIHISSIDSAKAISILGVVYIHVGLPFNSYFRFCVPIFIIASFYLTELFHNTNTSKDKEPLLKFYKKRLTRLVFPFLVWSIFYQLLQIIKNPSLVQFYIDNPLQIAAPWIGWGWTGQYYFLILFQLTLIYPLIRRFHINKLVLLGIASATYILFYLPLQILKIYPVALEFHDTPFFYWLPYVVMGIFFAREDLKTRSKLESGLMRSTKENKVTFFLKLILLPTLIVVEASIYKFVHMDVTAFSYSYASIMIVSPLFFRMFFDDRFPDNSWLDHTFTTLSKYTLGIFCLNPFLIWQVIGPASSRIADRIHIGNLSDFITFILTLITAWLLCRLFSRFRLTSLLVK